MPHPCLDTRAYPVAIFHVEGRVLTSSIVIFTCNCTAFDVPFKRTFETVWIKMQRNLFFHRCFRAIKLQFFLAVLRWAS